MTTIDLHIIRRFLVGILYLTLSLIIFFVVLHYVEYIDDFFDRGATMKDVFLVYYLNYLPEIVKLTSPLAVFLSSVYLTGKLSQKLQIAALQTSGVSLYRIMVPFLLVGILVSGFMFWFNGWVVPVTNQKVIEFEQRFLKGNQVQIDLHDVHRQSTPGSVITVGYYDRFSKVANKVSIQDYEESQRLILRLDADRMVWVDSTERWRLEGVTERHFGKNGWPAQREIDYLDTTLTVFPRDFARTQREVESMTVPDAREYIDSLLRSGANSTGRTQVAYFNKFAYPLANLIVVLIAVPLASVRRRGGQAIQMGIGLLVSFFYLATIKLVEPFGYEETLSPAMAAWLPHALFLILGIFLLIRAKK
ncbi:MAG: LptF/LptG family permease [Bacteroidota bacterium]